jgi:hypothetical protein
VWRGVHGLAQILTSPVTAGERRMHKPRNIDDSQHDFQARPADRFSMMTTVDLYVGRGSSASIIGLARNFSSQGSAANGVFTRLPGGFLYASIRRQTTL